jgi:hypothetical protein
VDRYQEAFEKFKRDVDYYEAHRGELLGKYPEQWIAIRDQQIIGAASSPAELRDHLRDRGLPTDRVLVRHLMVKEDLLVL